jgi:hypothetical protein
MVGCVLQVQPLTTSVLLKDVNNNHYLRQVTFCDEELAPQCGPGEACCWFMCVPKGLVTKVLRCTSSSIQPI